MKNKRQRLILDIIDQKVILTQDDLQTELLNQGYNVTQSTISRDIKELRLIKSHDADGNYRYVSPDTKFSSCDISHYTDVFIKSVKSVDFAVNNVVIKCHSGMASSACVALDEIFHDMMLGSLAGDDTIIVVTRSENHSQILVDKINNIL